MLCSIIKHNSVITDFAEPWFSSETSALFDQKNIKFKKERKTARVGKWLDSKAHQGNSIKSSIEILNYAINSITPVLILTPQILAARIILLMKQEVDFDN
jgi:hypothetical protein